LILDYINDVSEVDNAGKNERILTSVGWIPPIAGDPHPTDLIDVITIATTVVKKFDVRSEKVVADYAF
jgi:hypothetical protein